MDNRREEVIEEAERIQIEVDRIFETARSNNWSLEQFAIKVLAGATEFDLGYFAIASQLVQNVTELDGKSSIELLNYLLFKVHQMDTVKIKQAQEMFFRGLLINKQNAEKEHQQEQTSRQRRN